MAVTSAPAAGRPRWDRLTRALPVTVDLAVVGGVALCGLVDVLAADDPAGLAALIALGSVAMAALRRWAALPAIAVLAVGLVGLSAAVRTIPVDAVPPIAPTVAIAALSATAVRRQTVPWAVVAGALGAASVLAVATWPIEVEVRILLAVALGGAWTLGVGVGVYLRHLDDARVRAADDARRAERLDLARELHDLVAHYVTGIVVQAQAAQVVADRDPAVAGAALERIEGAGRDALAAMRGLVGTLRGVDEAAPLAAPVALDDLAGLAELAERARATGLPVDLVVDPEAGRAARGAVAASTHRIVQESLTNVHRHAVAPTRAEVAVRCQGAALVVTVTDDGRQPVGGPDDRTLTGAGFGIVGMTERAHALEGHLAAGPLDPPEQGWQVRAVLPLGPTA